MFASLPCCSNFDSSDWLFGFSAATFCDTNCSSPACLGDTSIHMHTPVMQPALNPNQQPAQSQPLDKSQQVRGAAAAMCMADVHAALPCPCHCVATDGASTDGSSFYSTV